MIITYSNIKFILTLQFDRMSFLNSIFEILIFSWRYVTVLYMYMWSYTDDQFLVVEILHNYVKKTYVLLQNWQLIF